MTIKNTQDMFGPWDEEAQNSQRKCFYFFVIIENTQDIFGPWEEAAHNSQRKCFYFFVTLKNIPKISLDLGTEKTE